MKKKVILSWLMKSNMVKPEKFDHSHLVYHFAVPLRSLENDGTHFLRKFLLRPKWGICVPRINIFEVLISWN